MMETKRFALSEKAKKFYSHQRCAAGRMSHEDAEKFAFELHYKIFEQIAPFIPKGEMAMDFGCGLGLINIFVAPYFDKLWLVDGDVEEKDLDSVFYGFHGKGYKVDDDFAEAGEYSENTRSQYCFYNDLQLSKQTLITNQIETELQLTHPSELDSLPPASFDFIQSHMSWGWHFPFSQYKKSIERLLKSNATLIVDIRNGSLREHDLVGFEVMDKLTNRESNSKKYVLSKC